MPRPSDKPTTALWARIETWLKDWEAQQGFELNQAQVAKMFGVSDSALSAWKYGDTVPKAEHLASISERTGIPFSELFGLMEQQLLLRRAQR